MQCMQCQKKKKQGQVKGNAVKPILSEDLLSQVQIDLIDMQSMAKGQYKWIFLYQDHFTKFCTLRALSSKTASEVALHLLDIFLTTGAPAILQSDNGAEFTAAVTTEVCKLWPELKIVHSKPRMPQSQGSIERANGDIKDMLICWMDDHNSTDWTTGITFVQFMKNSSHHTGIGMSPLKGMFGMI